MIDDDLGLGKEEELIEVATLVRSLGARFEPATFFFDELELPNPPGMASLSRTPAPTVEPVGL